MQLVALIHLCLLACLPLGLAMFRLRRRILGVLLAIPLLLVGITGLWLLAEMSPLDFLGLGRGFRVVTEAGEYTISFVQIPSDDYYESRFEVVRRDGRTAKVGIDGDDVKCWFPRLR